MATGTHLMHTTKHDDDGVLVKKRSGERHIFAPPRRGGGGNLYELQKPCWNDSWIYFPWSEGYTSFDFPNKVIPGKSLHDTFGMISSLLACLLQAQFRDPYSLHSRALLAHSSPIATPIAP